MTPADIADSIVRIVHATQVVELRALNVAGPRRTVAGWFDGRHLFDLARTALALTRQASGVYFTPNPVHPSLLARCPNRAEDYRRDRFALTTDADIVERRYLLVDFDPDRSDGNNDQPTDAAELQHAADAAAILADDFEHNGGWRKPLRMCSGNGVHLLFPLSAPVPAKLPAYEADPLRDTLALCTNWKFRGVVKVDTNTYTAARMLKVPGTWARKGEQSPGRLYRTATITEFPDGWPAPAEVVVVQPAGGDLEDVRGVRPRPDAKDPAGRDAGRPGRRARRRETPSSQGVLGETPRVDPGAER